MDDSNIGKRFALLFCTGIFLISLGEFTKGDTSTTTPCILQQVLNIDCLNDAIGVMVDYNGKYTPAIIRDCGCKYCITMYNLHEQYRCALIEGVVVLTDKETVLYRSDPLILRFVLSIGLFVIALYVNREMMYSLRSNYETMS